MNTKRALILLSILVTFVGSHARGQNVIAWGANTQGQCNVPTSATNVVAVAAGGTFSLALRSDGSVVAWGTVSNPPVDLTNAVQIAAGYSHCLALKADGMIVTWGNNNFSQLTVPPSATNIVAIATGYNHSLALRGDGTVVAWGRNDWSQCNVPLTLSNVVAVSAGEAQSLALKDDGTVVIWGNSPFYPEQLALAPFPSSSKDVLGIAAGANLNLAIRANGKVTAWGDTSFGQTRVPKGLTNVVAVAGGTNYGIALKTDGSVRAWGYPIAPAVSIPASATNILAIASGPQHCLAITGVSPIVRRSGMFQKHVTIGTPLPAFVLAAGDSYQWFKDGVPIQDATNAFPQTPAQWGSDNAIYSVVVSNSFGIATKVAGSLAVWPVAFWGDNRGPAAALPYPLTNASTLAAGAYHCLALNTDGTIAAWGKNTSGQTNVPANATNITQIAAGSDHSLALTRDGNVIAWGRNWDGQTNVPPSASGVTSIAAGWAHSVALRADGKVICWGNNDLDQTNVPFFVTNAIQVAAGYYHTLALRNDHSVVSWGLYSEVPAKASNVVAIAAGYSHSLALRADGVVIAWGDNYYGQATVPASVTNIIAIAAGFYHSVALRADGALISWGKSYYGVTNIPAGLPAMANISAGEDFTIGLPAIGIPQITRSPDSVTVHVGARVVFTTEVTGAQPLTVQWLHNGIPVGDATNHYLVLDNVQMADAGDYTLTVTNSLGQVTSGPATLSVLREPYVITLPIYTSVLVGQSFCIPASVTGEQPISFQWRRNGITLSDDGRISGSSSSILCVSTSDFPDNGDYQLVLNNAYGSFTGLVTHVSITPIIGWGDDFAGQLDIPPDTGQVIAVAAGNDHSLALRADGRVVAWGDNSFGQTSVPPSATNIVAIAAYGAQSMALTADGNVLAWGENRSGLTNIPSTAVTAVQIATSDTLSIVTRADRSIKSWGTGFGLNIAGNYISLTLAIAAGPNVSMRLDQSGILTSYGPFVSFGGSGFRAIAAGPKYIAGLNATGVVVQGAPVGGGSSIFTLPGTTNVAAFAMGQDHIPTLQSNGVPKVFLSNSLGQTNVPPVATNVVAIAAGANHNLALLGNSRPALAQQSSTRTFTLGDSTLLVAPSIGNAPATYQWQLNGTNIPMATTSYLMLSPIRWTNAGTYRPIISDAFGSVLGPATVLDIVAPVLQFDMSASSFQVTNGVFQLRVAGTSGTASTILYSSPDLIHWNPLLTNRPPRGAFDIAAPIFPDQPQMFYRIAEVYDQ